MALVDRYGWREQRVSQIPAKLAAAVTFVLEVATMVLLASMAILVFANAAGRYAFNRPLPWTEELVTNLMVWLVATGIVLAGMRQSLICCDILTTRLRGRVQWAMTTACALLGVVVLGYCAWLTWQYLGIFGRDLSPVLKIPKALMIGAIFFALAGLTLTIASTLLRRGGR
jgi:TRAP-type transport system small permease protein